MIKLAARKYACKVLKGLDLCRVTVIVLLASKISWYHTVSLYDKMIPLVIQGTKLKHLQSNTGDIAH